MVQNYPDGLQRTCSETLSSVKFADYGKYA